MLSQLSAKVILAPLKWEFDNQIKIDEPKVFWDLDMGAGEKRVSTINRLLVKSNLISFSGTGVIDPNAPTIWLQVNGNVDANLDKIAAIFSRITNQTIALSGNKESPFAFRMSRRDDPREKWFQKLSLKTHFPASRLTMMGITLEQMTMPAAIENGQIRFDLKATANDGNVTLAPSVDLKRAPRLLANEDMVFDNVRITQSMVDELLAKLHPLFNGATAGQGTVGLYIKNLDWPLTDKTKRRPILDGRLTFNQIALKTAGFIDEILTLIKADRGNITIENTVLDFSYKKGKIVTSPIVLKTDDTTIVLEGSMGFDQALDFVAKIPISKKMVSEKVYSLLVNSLLTIPISDTASNPQINRELLYTELERLVKEAGGKALKKEAEGMLDEIF
jgi:hypothetical protein